MVQPEEGTSVVIVGGPPALRTYSIGIPYTNAILTYEESDDSLLHALFIMVFLLQILTMVLVLVPQLYGTAHTNNMECIRIRAPTV